MDAFSRMQLSAGLCWLNLTHHKSQPHFHPHASQDPGTPPRSPTWVAGPQVLRPSSAATWTPDETHAKCEDISL